MRRFCAIAVAIALAASFNSVSWSQSGGGTGGSGGGALGGAGAADSASAAGTSGAATATGAANPTGSATTAGTAGSGVGTAAQPGAGSGVGTAPNPAANPNLNRNLNPQAAANANANLGQNQFGANAQQDGRFGMNQTPFFADPGIRAQLQLNNQQFNRLNTAYQRALQRYQGGVTTNTRAAADLAAGRNTAAAQRAQRLRDLQAQRDSNAAQGTAANNRAASANPGTELNSNPAAQQSAADQRNSNANLRNDVRSNNNLADNRARNNNRESMSYEEFRERFAEEFNPILDSTFTDPAMRQRYNQLNWQHQGAGAFSDPMVQQQLNLSPQQRQQFNLLAAEWRRDLANLQTNNRSNITSEQLHSLRERLANRINTILTPTQQQLWTQMLGDVYEFPANSYFPPMEPNRGGTVQQNSLDQVPQTGDRSTTTPDTGTVR